jgi:hypothetical protein
MRTTRLLVAACLGLALLGACGDDDDGGGGDALSEEDYLAAANAVCEAGNAELESAFEEFTAEPTPEEVADILVPNIRGQIEGLRALSGPDDLQEQIEGLMDDASEILDGIEEDPSIVFSEEDPFAEINATFDEIGLTDCTSD